MGDNSIRTKEQIQACKKFLEMEDDAVQDKALDSNKRRRASIRTLKWVLKEE